MTSTPSCASAVRFCQQYISLVHPCVCRRSRTCRPETLCPSLFRTVWTRMAVSAPRLPASPPPLSQMGQQQATAHPTFLLAPALPAPASPMGIRCPSLPLGRPRTSRLLHCRRWPPARTAALWALPPSMTGAPPIRYIVFKFCLHICCLESGMRAIRPVQQHLFLCHSPAESHPATGSWLLPACITEWFSGFVQGVCRPPQTEPVLHLAWQGSKVQMLELG